MQEHNLNHRHGRLEKTFAALKERKKKALVTFITAGDPDAKTTRDLILDMIQSGADIIELGVPFSDPMADGPTIQASSERALKNGVTLDDVLQMVRDVRMLTQVPIVLFGYYNPVFSYGLKKYAHAVKSAGVDGVLVVDLPAEESDELKIELDKVGVDLIFLLTPTSDAGRMKVTAKKASGFIYFVSVAGVTGARADISSDIEASVKKIRAHTKLPVAVGFGISTPEQAAKVGRCADGVVVGSAIINIIAASGVSHGGLLKDVSEFVSSLKRAL